MRGCDGGFVQCVVARGFGVFVGVAAVPGAALEAVSHGVSSGCITGLIACVGTACQCSRSHRALKQQLAVGIVVLPGLRGSVR